MLADAGANITGQYLATRGEQGYVVTDTLDPLPEDALAKLAESEHDDLAAHLGRLSRWHPRRTLGPWRGCVNDSGHELFLRVAGPDGPVHAERIHGRPGPRWFEPDSPIARVHGDASMFVGGIRALLLQTLHPAAMRGVAEHSGYRGDMWGRLARTSRFLAVTTFGHAEDAEQAVAIVRAIHERVTGTMRRRRRRTPPPTRTCSAGCTSPRSTASCAPTTRYGAEPLAGADRDTYVAQAGEVARRLGRARPARDRGGAGRRCWRRTGPSCAAPARPARRCATCCCARRCRCSRARRTACWWPPRSG